MLDELSTSLLTEGYRYRADLAESGGDPPAVPVRVLGRRSLLVAGEEGARLFYDRQRMHRAGAVPAPLSRELFGEGAVHGLDGSDHRRRKGVHLDALGGAEVGALVHAVESAWTVTHATFPSSTRMELFDLLVAVLGRAALDWSGVGAEHARTRSRDLSAVVDGFGSIGPRYRRGREARRRCEWWARAAIRAARREPGERPVHRVAAATGADGALLPVDVAAVELLNLVRPIVAIAWFGAFVPRALGERPDWRSAVGPSGDEASRLALVHEIRRHFPFVPVLAARSDRTFTWYGHRIRRGQRVVLHVVATNHDPRRWSDPWSFRPERFVDRMPGPYEFVAQGGGDMHEGHRCPGEPAVVAVLTSLLPLISSLPQERAVATFDSRRMPTFPRCTVGVGPSP